MKKSDLNQMARDMGLAIWRSVAHNFWYKAMSVLIAVILWSYVISSNPAITRAKILDVDIRLTGESSFKNQNFALVTDVTASVPTAQVRVEVPQQSYQAVTTQNVTADLDLSQVRTTGKQTVKLKGTSVLGTAVSCSPDSIEIEVDKKAVRDVPVNPKEVNAQKDKFWYHVKRTNPSYINVTGPASVVERIASAEVTLDYAKQTRSQSVAFAPVFLDADGNEVLGNFTPSTSTVTVDFEIYPTKVLPVTADIDALLSGELPSGYEIDGITASPNVITVAAEQALLDSLTEVQLRPVNVEQATQSFNRLTAVSKLEGVKNYSTENVNVKVDIIEQSMDKEFSDQTVKLTGLDESRFTVKWGNPSVYVTINDVYSVVSRITKNDLRITVDLSQITSPGSYQIPIRVRVDNYPELAYSVEPQVATVTVSAIE